MSAQDDSARNELFSGAAAPAGHAAPQFGIEGKTLEDLNERCKMMDEHTSTIVVNTQRIEDSAARTSTAFSADAMDQLTAEVSGYTSESRAAAQAAKQILQGLKKLGDELKQNKDADPRGTAQFRLFQNRYHEMYSKFHKAVGDNQVARATFKERVTDRAVSQARIIFPERSEAELSTLVTANPQALQEHLQAPELVAHSNVQDVFDEVQERNEAINELVRSMAEINELMQDLAVLVQEQSEHLQRIDQQVGSAVQRIEKGNKELEKAIRYQKAARRKYCCIAIVGIIILVVILGSVIPTSVSSG